MPTPPDYPIADLAADLAAARRVRAEWLIAIEAGMLGAADLVNTAATPSGAALRAVTLHQLFVGQPGWDGAKTARAIMAVRRICGVDRKVPTRRLTVGWALDARSDGRRIRALAEALVGTDRKPPTPRFPYPDRPATQTADLFAR